MTSIITQVETIGGNLLAIIEDEAKQIASGVASFVKTEASAALDGLISFLKETSLGTAIMNLISAANSSTASGYDKFAAVLLAAQNAWGVFTSNGGLSGVWAVFKSALTYVVQKFYEAFAATFLKVA